MSEIEFGDIIPINSEKDFERKLSELIEEYETEISVYNIIESLKYYINRLKKKLT